MADDRRSPRKATNAVVSVQLEPKNDAIVLNVSEGGMGFRALNPVGQSGTIRFSFLENGQRIDSIGKLVWIDAAKKNGGLSFEFLSSADRERIRKWVGESGTPVAAGAAAEPATATRKEPTVTPPAPPQPNAAPRPDFQAPNFPPNFPPPGFAQPGIPSAASPSPQAAQPGFALFEDAPQRPRYRWDQGIPIANSPAKFFRGFLTGAIVAAIVAGILLFAYSNPANPLRVLVSERIGTSPAPQPSAPSPPPLAADPAPRVAPEPQPPSGAEVPAPPPMPPAFAEDSTRNPAPAKSTAEPPLAEKHGATDPERSSPKPAEAGDEDLALAQRYLNDKSGPGASLAASRFLWAAVEKGSVKAEVTLAGLYARGDGVAKSCVQARVLLQAAARRGSREASQELAQIIRRGCY